MIDVRLFATLPMHSATGRKQFQLEPRAQLTVGEVVDAEGLRRADIHIIMINGKHASMDSERSESIDACLPLIMMMWISARRSPSASTTSPTVSCARGSSWNCLRPVAECMGSVAKSRTSIMEEIPDPRALTLCIGRTRVYHRRGTAAAPRPRPPCLEQRRATRPSTSLRVALEIELREVDEVRGEERHAVAIGDVRARRHEAMVPIDDVDLVLGDPKSRHHIDHPALGPARDLHRSLAAHEMGCLLTQRRSEFHRHHHRDPPRPPQDLS